MRGAGAEECDLQIRHVEMCRKANHTPPVPATLTTLRIRNLALVEHLDWTLQPGFTAVTGETGAGKSVIIGALNLLVGERADRSLLRTGADQCSVEGEFFIEDQALLTTLNGRLAEQGIEPCEGGQLLIKRVFTAAGANRQFVNCSGTTLAVLKEMGDQLVDLHGPHDHQSLFALEHQRAMLDACAGSGEQLAEYQRQFRALQQMKAEAHRLATSENLREQELDLLRFQVEEIQSANIQPGEDEPLAQKFSQASNSRKLLELASRISGLVNEADDSILTRLGEVGRHLRELERLDPSVTPLYEAHTRAVLELEELQRDLSDYAESLEIDPEQFMQVEARLTLLENLKRKYGPTLEQVIATGEKAEARLRSIEGRDDALARLQHEMKAAGEALAQAGASLTRARAHAAPELAQSVQGHLSELGFRQAGFEVVLRPLAEPAAHGMEDVEFVFSPNPGELAQPLRAIASSGEISRVMLALKTSLAARDSVSLLVFDEIDANVGGEIAHAVGRKMAALAGHHQLLVITHLPQVAAQAAHQFVVRKELIGDRTHSLLELVVEGDRTAEVARMLGGESDESLAMAASLLSGVGAIKNKKRPIR